MKVDLSAILEYEMTDLEGRAYKLALIWEQVSYKLFPGKKISKLRRKGDPRKSYLFKCCYGLAKRMQGVLAEDDYKYFIYANLKVQKDGYSQNKDRVDPSCLIGDKAWWRWKVWNKRFEDTKNYGNAIAEEVKTVPHHSKVIRELEETRDFLLDIFKKTPTKEDILTAVESRSILRWLTFGKISPYFIVLCPDISNDGWGRDLGVYKNHINDDVEKWYSENFKK